MRPERDGDATMLGTTTPPAAYRWLILAMCCLLFGCATTRQTMTVPREYMQEIVTIASAETAAEADRAALEAKFKSETHTMIFDGNLQLVPISPETHAAMEKATAKTVLEFNSDWQTIKAFYREGDTIHRFAWPPLSGPIGYVLMRGEKQIHVAITGYQ